MPQGGTSNEYPQHMFAWRNKKNINTFGLKKASYQELWLLQVVQDCKNLCKTGMIKFKVFYGMLNSFSVI